LGYVALVVNWDTRRCSLRAVVVRDSDEELIEVCTAFARWVDFDMSRTDEAVYPHPPERAFRTIGSRAIGSRVPARRAMLGASNAQPPPSTWTTAA
jgi:hypothetical protein